MFRYYKLMEPPGTPFNGNIAEIRLVVNGVEVIPETASASSAYSSGFDASKVIDNNSATYWQSSVANDQQWVMIGFSSPVSASAIKLQNRNYTPVVGCVSGVVSGSNDTTNGTDGDWFVLAENVNMGLVAGVWTTHELVMPLILMDSPKTHSVSVLSAMPAALTRGFR